METIIGFLFFNCFFVSILLGGLSFLIARRINSQELMHLSEFWISITSMMVISVIFRSSNPFIVGISLVGWIWPIKTIFQIVRDLSGVEINYRLNNILLGVGGFLTLVMAAYALPFEAFTLPFALAYFLVGGILIRNVYVKSQKNFTILAHATYILLGLFFVVRLAYPFWRMSEMNVYGVSALLVSLMGLGASTLAHYIEVSKEAHEKELQSVIKERNQQLFGQSKYSELGMMAAGIAHEINNPLAIIQAKTTQLLRVVRDPARIKDVSDGLEQILFTSERINRTIQGVRDFVHQDERVPSEMISIKNLVDDVMSFTGQRLKNHGVNLRFYGLDPYSVRGNKIQLEQVLLNLLNNAFDAIEFLPEKWIEMSAHDTGDCLHIYVKDSGPGIPPEVAMHMMDPFFTTKRMGKGTGLGLALARGIVEQHGGSLVYVSNATHTTFLIQLPKENQIQLSNPEDEQQPLIH